MSCMGILHFKLSQFYQIIKIFLQRPFNYIGNLHQNHLYNKPILNKFKDNTLKRSSNKESSAKRSVIELVKASWGV